MEDIQDITVLVNPAAGDNEGLKNWQRLQPHFEELFGDKTIHVIETQSRDHTIRLGSTLETDLIVSVSGDGALSDIVQGLMMRPREQRPVLTIIPVGSGNDFVRALGIPTNPWSAISRLAQGQRTTIDIGRVNEHYYINTLSFGVDAAIAFRTSELRRTTRRRGFVLYGQAAISAILHELKPHHCTISIDGVKTDRNLEICAVQNGPYYGGGFKVAPKALLNDGKLNVCMVREISKPKALYYLAHIARGTHENFPEVDTTLAEHLDITYDELLPVQHDGEETIPIETEDGRHRYVIDIVPQAIEVIRSR